MAAKFRVVVDPRIGVRLMSGPLDYVAAHLEARRFAEYAPQVLVDRPVLREAQRHAPITVGVPCRCKHPQCSGIGRLTGWVYPEPVAKPLPIDDSLVRQTVRAAASDQVAASAIERAVRRRPAVQLLRLIARAIDAFSRILPGTP